MTCPICGREPARASELCNHHEMARNNILAAYQKWIIAFGDMEWAEFLHKIEKLEGSGEWTREVAKYLVLKSG
jgi:hypothetical protein